MYNTRCESTAATDSEHTATNNHFSLLFLASSDWAVLGKGDTQKRKNSFWRDEEGID